MNQSNTQSFFLNTFATCIILSLVLILFTFFAPRYVSPNIASKLAKKQRILNLMVAYVHLVEESMLFYILSMDKLEVIFKSSLLKTHHLHTNGILTAEIYYQTSRKIIHPNV